MSTWECLNCGYANEKLDEFGKDIEACAGCEMDREQALTMVVARKKKKCEECGHLHREEQDKHRI